MARPIATSIAVSCAAATCVALSAAIPEAPPPIAAPTPPRTVPSHTPGAAARWARDAHRVYEEVERRMRGRRSAHPTRIARAILDEASRVALDPLLVVAVIQVESGFDPQAVSSAGAVGLMQLADATLRAELARPSRATADPLDPVTNVRAGIRYLGRMLRWFGDLDVALMAYNAGPGRIRGHLRSGGVPERFLVYPRSVNRVRTRLAGEARALAMDGRRRAAPAAASHPSGERRAAARWAADIIAPPMQRPRPSVSDAAPLAVAVPGGWRRRALAGT